MKNDSCCVVPSRQLYPTTTIFMDSLHCSVSKLQLCATTRLQFLRYYSSISCNKGRKFAIFSSINSDSTPQRNPEKKSNLVLRNKNNRLGSESNSSISVSSCRWLDSWNDTSKQNWPKSRQAVVNYRNSENVLDSDYEDGSDSGGNGSGSTMDKIVEKLKKFGYVDDVNEKKEMGVNRVIEKGSVEDIFYVEEGMLPNAHGGFSPESPLGMEHVFRGSKEVRFPWEKPDEEEGRNSMRHKSRTSLAELTLPESELRRLRNLAVRTKNKTRIGGGGVTQAVVDLIRDKWKSAEVVRLKIEGAPALNMKRMHEILEKLTGGMLLSRNKDFLVFYRGKNFLSPDVAEALLEKERLAKALQDKEEQARLRASTFYTPTVEATDESGTAGTLGESLDANARWGKRLDDNDKDKVMREAEVVRHANLVRKLEKKLTFADRKLMKAERSLSKVEAFLNPLDCPADPGSITDEERFMFRKLGLRMKAFLLLGRRGVFDGTVENMHLHWKYRELVKIIVKAKNFEQVKRIALSLEAESGGVLVSVDKVSKGYAIIVFRGKEYKRPPALRPKNLLTKRKALARSIELQRREALLNHISTLQTRVDSLHSEIHHMSVVKDRGGDEELYTKLESAYPTEDEESEEEGDDAYLEIYDSDNGIEDES